MLFFIFSWHRILLSFAMDKLNLQLNHFVQDDINTYYLVNGLLKKTHAVESDPDILNYNLTGEEKGKSAAQLFSQALWKVCTNSAFTWTHSEKVPDLPRH